MCGHFHPQGTTTLRSAQGATGAEGLVIYSKIAVLSIARELDAGQPDSASAREKATAQRRERFCVERFVETRPLYVKQTHAQLLGRLLRSLKCKWPSRLAKATSPKPPTEVICRRD